MTTVSDPSGSPIPVYNRSGTTIVTMDAVGTAASGPGVGPIQRLSGVTVALVTIPDENNFTVTLPDDAEIGDVVEVYLAASGVQGQLIWIWAPSGETIGLGTTGANATQAVNIIFRKAAATAWYAVKGA